MVLCYNKFFIQVQETEKLAKSLRKEKRNAGKCYCIKGLMIFLFVFFQFFSKTEMYRIVKGVLL